jgi:hypothetical protein
MLKSKEITIFRADQKDTLYCICAEIEDVNMSNIGKGLPVCETQKAVESQIKQE